MSDILSVALFLFGICAALLSSWWVIADLSRRMKNITEELSNEARVLSTVATEITDASSSLAESSTQQSSAIEETVSSMEEIASMIAQTAENSSGTMSEASKGQAEATKGKEVVARMVKSMDDISESNDQLQTIVKMMEEIKNRTRVINDIAFETKLLSFNASIEAARAGAHGRGFAVVAEEVGKLANVSSKAADEVRELLDNSSSKVGSIIEGTKERVSNGQINSRDCEAAFITMETALDAISRSVKLIATATREQEGGVKQTNQAMGEMERATQSNARNADKLARQSHDLRETASKVAETIGVMRMMVVGERGEESKATTLSRKVKRQATETSMRSEGQRPATANQSGVVLNPGINDQLIDIERDDDRWGAA